jgi:hypothetical protein
MGGMKLPRQLRWAFMGITLIALLIASYLKEVVAYSRPPQPYADALSQIIILAVCAAWIGWLFFKIARRKVTEKK